MTYTQFMIIPETITLTSPSGLPLRKKSVPLFNHGVLSVVEIIHVYNLVPRPKASHYPVFDHLQYAKMEGKAWSISSCE